MFQMNSLLSIFNDGGGTKLSNHLEPITRPWIDILIMTF